MSHEVETLFTAREIPWHGLGTVTDDLLTYKQAITTAQLDWKVETAPVYALIDGEYIEITDKAAPYRRKAGSGLFLGTDDQIDIYSVMGSTWTPVQNEQMFEFVEALLDTGEVRYESAGSLRNGAVVFACARLEKEIVIDDTYVPYMVVSNGHDGSMAFRSMATPVKVVCMNTLTAAGNRAVAKLSLRHTPNIQKRVDQARQALGLTYKYYDTFEDEVTRLLNQSVTDDQFTQMVEGIFPVGEDATDTVKINAMERQAAVSNLWHNSETIQPIRNTAWGAVNSFNEWELWRKGRGRPSAKAHLTGQALRILRDQMPFTEKAMAMVKKADTTQLV